MNRELLSVKTNWGERLFAVAASTIPPLVATLTTVQTLEVVRRHYPVGSFLRRLLAPEGELYMRAVPAAIIFLFSWTMIAAVFHLVRILFDRWALRPFAIDGADSLATVATRRHLLGRLVAPVVDVADDRSSRHEVFRHQTEIEAGHAAGRYGILRLFVWAMPILGFIGTVIGIGVAVGEFSGFLSGDIDDLEMVKRELSKVSTGLSFAFDTTLLGLVASLIAMTLVSAVQSIDEGVQARTETIGLRMITAGGAAEWQVPTFGNPDVLAAEMSQVVGRLTGSTQAVSSMLGSVTGEVARLRDALDAHASAFRETLTVGDIIEKLSELGAMQVAVADRLAVLPELVSRIEMLSSAQHRSIEKLDRLADLAPALERMSTAHDGLATRLEAMHLSLESIDRLIEVEQNVAAGLTVLRDMPHQVGKLADAHAGVVSKLESLSSLPAEFARTADSHAETVDRLTSFNDVLERLHQCVDRSSQVLSRLSSPLEFRLVASSEERA